MGEAKKRFEITLKGEDKHYFYVEVKPRNQTGRVEPRGRPHGIGSGRAYLPAQFWLNERITTRFNGTSCIPNAAATHI